MSNISRRQFLKGAGVATLAVAAAGMLAGCSKEDVPVIPEVTTRPVMVIFMADKGNGETVVVGETAKIDVLKTEDSVKVADIDKKLLPEVTIWRTKRQSSRFARMPLRASTSSSL